MLQLPGDKTMESLQDKYSAIIKELRSHAAPLTIEELADRLGWSIRTTRRHIIVLEKKRRITFEVGEKGRKLYRPFTKAERESFEKKRGKEPKPYFSKEEEIIQRYEKYREIHEQKEKILDFLQAQRADELRKSIVDYLAGTLNKLESKQRLTDADRKQKLRCEKEIARFEKALSFSNSQLLLEISQKAEDKDVTVGGTDASLENQSLFLRIGNVPAMLNFTFTAAAANIVTLEEGIKVLPEKVLLRPKRPYPITSEHMEELSSAYPEMSIEERYNVSFTMMNTLHLELDEEVLLPVNAPEILFHDGRLVPPHIHYLDLKDEPRRSLTWKNIQKTLAVRQNAQKTKTKLVGVVKTFHPKTALVSHILDYACSQIIKDWQYGSLPRDERIALSFLLRDRQATGVFLIEERHVNLATPRDEKSARGVLPERYYEAYAKSLDELKTCAFYLKYKDFITRYEFPFHASQDIQTIGEDIADLAYYLSLPQTRGRRLVTGTEPAAVPVVVVEADRKSREWVSSLADLGTNVFRSAFVRKLGIK